MYPLNVAVGFAKGEVIVSRGLRYFYYLAKLIVLYVRYCDRSISPPGDLSTTLTIVEHDSSAISQSSRSR